MFFMIENDFSVERSRFFPPFSSLLVQFIFPEIVFRHDTILLLATEYKFYGKRKFCLQNNLYELIILVISGITWTSLKQKISQNTMEK